eukprot:TRINITY_DN18447_c0_g1_i1.p3 TRINITY_DN18447_c0_g1~~TRINITY_DN18447_c0_g1_i1.p3  ORF type:complete len:252 (-),score=78.32 TRINITY_DN18447_c0_g1_i1:3-758(-)
MEWDPCGEQPHGWTMLPVGDSAPAAAAVLRDHLAGGGTTWGRGGSDGGGVGGGGALAPEERVPAFRVCPRDGRDVAANALLHVAACCGFITRAGVALVLKRGADADGGGGGIDDGDDAAAAAAAADIVALRLPTPLVAYLRSTCAAEVRRGRTLLPRRPHCRRRRRRAERRRPRPTDGGEGARSTSEEAAASDADVWRAGVSVGRAWRAVAPAARRRATAVRTPTGGVVGGRGTGGPDGGLDDVAKGQRRG